MLDPAFDQALELQEQVGLIDMHVDSIIQQRLFRYDVLKRHKAKLSGQPFFWHADIPRMVEGRYRGACMGIHYYPWESERGWRECNRQIDYLDKICDAHDQVLRVRSPADWSRAESEGKLALAPGVEGTHMINGELSRIGKLAERGVSYLTLAHFSKNSAATPSMGRGKNESDGLSAFGKDVVRELNRHGMVADLAHVNTPGVLDACTVSEAPIMVTHTGVKAVHDHARNITNEEIDAIAEIDGAIGVMFAPGFLAGKFRADTRCVLDHLDYIVERVGVRHACIGSDYDGWLPSIPSDHRDCRDMVRVTHGLMSRGYSDEDIGRILWDNAIRVMQDAWEKRANA